MSNDDALSVLRSDQALSNDINISFLALLIVSHQLCKIGGGFLMARGGCFFNGLVFKQISYMADHFLSNLHNWLALFHA